MRVVVYGHKGFLGTFVTDVLKRDGHIVIPGTARIDDADRLIDELCEVKPDRVLSCTGRTHGDGINTIDYLEGGRDKLVVNLRDNLQGPLNLAHACTVLKIHCTIISTGCIYHSQYDAEGHVTDVPFDEYDKPNFFGSSYSVVKGFTDQLMQHYDEYVLTLRIRLPVMNKSHPRNTLTKIFSYKKLCSLDNAITDCRLFERFLIPLMQMKIVGPLNFVNKHTVSHKFIIDTWRRYQKPDHECEFISYEELSGMLKSLRSNNAMDTRRLEELFPDLETAEAAIEHAIRTWDQ